MRNIFVSENGEEKQKYDFNGIVVDLPPKSTTMITVF
jgi:hypothetical protein